MRSIACMSAAVTHSLLLGPYPDHWTMYLECPCTPSKPTVQDGFNFLLQLPVNLKRSQVRVLASCWFKKGYMKDRMYLHCYQEVKVVYMLPYDLQDLVGPSKLYIKLLAWLLGPDVLGRQLYQVTNNVLVQLNLLVVVSHLRCRCFLQVLVDYIPKFRQGVYMLVHHWDIVRNRSQVG